MEVPIPSTSKQQLTHSTSPTLINSAHSNTFFRDARLCPDHSSVVCSAEDRSLSLFSLSSPSSNQEWSPERTYRPSDSLLSYEWYPGASSVDPSMYCFTVAVKDHPVQLIDGNDLRVRASYPIVDHQEKFVAPHSMAFSPDGTKLFAGSDSSLEILDISAPGSSGERIPTSPTRSSKAGQKGIISTLDFQPNRSGLLAAGSFNSTVGLYDTSSPPSISLVHLLRSSSPGGVTKVKFHPASHVLYVASRLSPTIDIWDLRNLREMKGRFLRTEKGGQRTNQRVGFDVDESGEWVVAGAVDGSIQVFEAEVLESTQGPYKTFSVSDRGTVGATLFTSPSTLLTCSGTRTYRRRRTSSDSSDDEEEEEEVAKEPSLKLWELH